MLPSVLVLGGHGDIGAAIAARFRQAGHAVVATGRADLDLGKPASIDAFFAAQKDPFGVVVHSAGLNNPQTFDRLTQAEIEECLNVNVNGFLRVMRHALPGLCAQGGRVVVLSSIYGFLSRVGRLPYAASKHALVGIVKSLALEYAKDGVLVNAVSPGYIDTKLTHKNNDAATIARLTGFVPLGRMGTPEDIAEVVHFLGSVANRYITGQDIVADGGFTIDGGR